MERGIKLTESELYSFIKEAVVSVLNEAYDKNFLDGISNIDNKSIDIHIKNMIPFGNRVSVNSPYKPIRQLVLYFSKDGAIKHGGKLTKDIVNYIMRTKSLNAIVRAITLEDKKIIEDIYGNNDLAGKDLMQKIVWHLEEMSNLLLKFNDEYNKSNIKNYFDGTEAMDGSPDGKRKGLRNIVYDAFMGLNEIKEQIKKMQKIIDTPKDAFSYRTGRTINR